MFLSRCVIDSGSSKPQVSLQFEVSWRQGGEEKSVEECRQYTIEANLDNIECVILASPYLMEAPIRLPSLFFFWWKKKISLISRCPPSEIFFSSIYDIYI